MKLKRIASLLLTVAMLFSMAATAAPAYGEELAEDSGLCPHHTAHTAECGYVQAQDEQPCEHVHDEDCGYAAAVEGQPCNHVCTVEYGCLSVSCTHVHDDSCGYSESDGSGCNHVCTEESGCIVKNCTHSLHDEDCGYVQAQDEQPCNHVHDEDCGYAPAVEAQPCTFQCQLCEYSNRAENDEIGDMTVLASETISVTWQPASTYAPIGQPVTITVSAQLDSESADSAVISIKLSDAEAAMLTVLGEGISLTDTGASDGTQVLSFTVNKGVPFSSSVTASSKTEASLEIDGDRDVSIEYQPTGTSAASSQMSMGNLHFVEAEGTVTVNEYGTVPPISVGYLDSEGKSVSLPESAPGFALYYKTGDGEDVLLDGENLPFGLTEMPQIKTEKNQDGTKWTASVDTQLPVLISTADGQGSSREQTVTWTLMPEESSDDSELKWLSGEDLEQYEGADAEGWYYILPPDEYQQGVTVVVDETLDSALVKKIFWADNNNSAGNRPGDLNGSYVLEFALDGSNTYSRLNEENMGRLGLETMPSAVSTDLGGGSWELSVKSGTLPASIRYKSEQGESSHTVSWRLVPTDSVSGYSMVEINEGNSGNYPTVSQLGTYYVLQSSFSFTVKLNRGDTTLGAGLSQAFNEQFYFTAEYSGGTQLFQLGSMGDYISYSIPEGQDTEHPNLVNITVSNLWKYNVDNSRMLYSIEEGTVSGSTAGGKDGRMELDSLSDGDYFAISYDNSASPGYGSELTKVREGGTINLTLTGTVDYTAYKDWLDDGQTVRPTASMHLWRYRQGASYSTASVVRDSDNNFVTLTLGENTKLDENGSRHSINFSGLSKYDPEGYPYIYVVREYLSGDNAQLYEKVFGSVAADGTVTDTVEGVSGGGLRQDGNTWLYDGGTLSNRLIGSIPVSATKEWKAASFQSEFEDVTVHISLQSRQKGSKGEWKDTGIYHDMDDFYAENLVDSFTGYYPAYDEMGQALEYRWVESAVFQNGLEVQSMTVEDSRSFTLSQGGRSVTYLSQSSISSSQDGISHTYITNTISDTIYYQVEKKWAEGVEPHSCSFDLYRSVGGTAPERYVTFTVDGISSTEQIKAADGTGLTVSEEPAWTVKITGLPEFDESGHKYEYMLLESGGSPLSITTVMNGPNYESTVINGVGTGGTRILVRKEWVDDSDIQHREPVTLGIYAKDGNKEIKEITLGEGNTGWYSLVDIGSYKADDVYVLELKVGDTALYDSSEPKEPDAGTAVQYSTLEHEYEASYSTSDYGETRAFTVTNRRLGDVDITVTKSWADGTGQQREELQQALDDAGLSLAVRLDFRNGDGSGYTITRVGYGEDGKGDSVSISQNSSPILDDSGRPADSIQKLDLKQDSQNIYFWNLPKYDTGGASVRYTVSEVFVDAAGNEEDISKYPDLESAYKNYRLSYTEGAYIVGEKHAHDTQSFTLVNGLTDTKSVTWHCLWLDDYVFSEGSRPDIYLDIYAKVHVPDAEGGITTKTELYQAEYKWEYDSANPGSFWTCTMDGLPRYDELGYEIEYFATVGTMVNYDDFYYLPVRYSADKDEDGNAVFGTEAGLNNSGDTANADRIEQLPQSSDYALESGNTFVFMIDGTVNYAGEKLWTNLPGRYPEEDLPKLTFNLDRKLADTNEDWTTNVASLTVDSEDWPKLRQNDSYVFTMLYEGANILGDEGEVIQQQSQTPLPRFDDKGRIYEYRLVESIDWTGTDAGAQPDTDVFSTTVLGHTITNNYELGSASLTVKKYLTVTIDQVKNKETYPAVTMVLKRGYEKSDSSMSEPETVDTLVWSYKEVKAAVEAAADGDGDKLVTVEHSFVFETLPVYAPNGSRYDYTVEEDKSQLGGYDTWAATGDVSAENIKIKGEETASISGLSPDETEGVDASFLNETNDDQLTIYGEKQWDDLNNVFRLRPQDGTLKLTLQRIVSSQTGQDNNVGWVVLEPDDYTVTWDAVDGNPNRWSYTITDLERYAPNGMEYVYRINELVLEHYQSGSSSHVQTDNLIKDEGDWVQVKDITNKLNTEISFAKSWVDEKGAALSANALGSNVQLEVSFQLQLRAKSDGGSGDYGQWQDAAEFFAGNLSADALAATGLGVYNDSYSIRGGLTAKDWKNGGKFAELPMAVRTADGSIYSLQYRVVETEVKIYVGDSADPVFTQVYTANTEGDSISYTVSQGPFAPSYPEGTQSQAISEKTHTNMLSTTELTVTKFWDDNGSSGSRPGGENWTVSFLLQRSSDGVNWENTDTVHTLSGSGDSASFTLDDLPLYLISQNGTHRYYYRAVELQPDADLSNIQDTDIVLGGEIFYDKYMAHYEWENGEHTELKVTNVLVSGLTISKTVSGHLEDVDTQFAFELVLSDNTVTGTYGGVEFKDGTASFVLKDGQSVHISDLSVPAGTGYTITETGNAGAVLTSTKTTVVTEGGNTVSTTPENSVTGKLNSDSVISVLFTNKYEENINIPVTKEWQDNNDQAGKRPESVTVTLLENGVTTGNSLTLNEVNGWSGSFDDLPKYDANGDEISYSLREHPVENYTGDIEGDAETGFTIINSYTPPTIEVCAEKRWDDNNDQDGIRPDAITLKLKNGNTVVRTETVTPDDKGSWECSFIGLPKFDSYGKEIVYTLEELKVEDYSSVITGDAEKGFVITNSHTPETVDISGSKTWDDDNDRDGKRPSSITVRLYADGQELKDKALTVTENDGWQWSFEDLPKYSGGKEIVYTITEDAVPDYVSAVNGYDLTNSYTPGKTSVNVVKVWQDGSNQDGIRPGSITVTLLANGQETGKTLELKSDNSWTGSFTDLDVYDNGVKIVYTVKELSVSGYQVSISGDAVTGFTITNTHTPATVDISGSKTWNDDNDRDGKRPDSITVRLYADGRELTDKVLTVTAADDWKWSFEDLPKDSGGKEIEYTITEDPVTGYTPNIQGYDIVNTHSPETVNISGSKTWNDDNDRDGKRPSSITVRLYADGQELKDKALTVTENDGWQWSFEDLPKYSGGKEIVYTITEDAVPDYVSAINGYDLTNSYMPGKTGINVAKVWQDNNNQGGMRPGSITVALLANGRDTGKTLELKSDTGWTGSFTDLDVYDNGVEIIYTVKELSVSGYQVSISGDAITGFVITNSRVSTDDPKKEPGIGPRTGDTSDIELWAALAGLSCLGMSGTVLMARSRKAKKKDR